MSKLQGLISAYHIKPGRTDCRDCPFFNLIADQHCHARFVRIFQEQCNLIQIKRKLK